MAEKSAGRPPGAKTMKHGFYYNKLRPCLKCDKHKDESCPYFFEKAGREHQQEFMFDEFGVARCVPEANYFKYLRNLFKKSYKITEGDEPLLDKMCMIIIRSGRVEEYLADEGLLQMRKLKDDKTGQIHDVLAQNLLKKDAYFDDKMIREWLENLKISRKSRDVISEDDDLAIVFTQEKSIKIKGSNKEQVKELAQKVSAKIQNDKNPG